MVNPPNKTDQDKDPRLVMDGQVYEMMWDCRFCGTTKLLGKTHRFCPNCGSPQDPSWRYFPADDEKIAVKDHVYVGADVVCSYCGTLNSGNAEYCRNCGGPQTEAAKVKTLGERSAAKGQALAREDLTARQDIEAAVAVSGKPLAAADSGGWKPWHYILIGVVILIVGGGLFTMFSTKAATVVLADFRWDRTIEIERLSAVSDSSVCSSMPADAYSVTRRREQVDTRQVPDGQVCTRRQIDNGDGTFREQESCQTKYRDEPVYGDVCYYTVDRWTTSRQAVSNGNKSIAPTWANTNITRTGSCRGCEREGKRTENYILIFKGDGDNVYECGVDFNVWQNAKAESVWELEVGRVLNDARCGSLKPAS